MFVNAPRRSRTRSSLLPKRIPDQRDFDLSEPVQYILIIKQPSVEELAEERGDVAV
jgi:hypothetical protein